VQKRKEEGIPPSRRDRKADSLMDESRSRHYEAHGRVCAQKETQVRFEMN